MYDNKPLPFIGLTRISPRSWNSVKTEMDERNIKNT